MQLRRENGACANAITRFLTIYRNRVIVAPTGNYGSIGEVIMHKAGDQKVSDNDTRNLIEFWNNTRNLIEFWNNTRNLIEFWKQIYDIDISPDEIPLLRVKMVNSEATFTYPPNMCFFAGGDSLVIPAGVQKFIESKKSTLKTMMDEVASKAIRDLKIGDSTLGSDAAITEEGRPSNPVAARDQAKTIWQKCIWLGFCTFCT